MPLRDHFHPPLSETNSWEVINGQWPAMIVLRLHQILPRRFIAGPRIYLKGEFEIDVGTVVREGVVESPPYSNGYHWEASSPSLAVETDWLAADEYEVRITDVARGRRLVAAIEIVSPSNKDRSETRRSFVNKCETLLRAGVSVTIVDIVTFRRFNLYTELLDTIGQRDQQFEQNEDGIYAASCRWIKRGDKHILETWSHALQVGQPLPTLPLWLLEDYSVPLELESTYEQTCSLFQVDS